MTTYASLADEITQNLQGFTVSPDQVTFLTGSVDNAVTTLMVDDITQMGRGQAEVDSEMVYIKATDSNTGTVTLAPFGRGYNGTTAVAHSANAKVVMSPTWPRSKVKSEINRAINALYPTLFAVQAAPPITTDGITYQYDVPALAERVVDVRWLFNTFDGWQRSVKWEQENSFPSTSLTGRVVSIYDNLPAGATVQILYATRPANLVNDADDFATVTGLTDSCSDLVILSVMSRMAQFIDVGRLPVEAAAADALAQQRPTGGPTQIANQLYKQYQQRLADEQRALTQRYPVRGHKVR